MDLPKSVNYSKSEKFRAEIFKYGGFVLCTPYCFLVFNGLVEGKSATQQATFVAGLLFLFGYGTLKFSYAIMEKRDNDYGQF